ncbi:hypothetical protein K438DRAFT_2130586 [Mycena galopus ATCC 62051]|nr:hypothetical protein K438DRAFT_2130586 [Mycena galopus ATCC 62051]
MSGNSAQAPVPRVRQYNRTPAPLTIPVIPNLASVSASNSPVTPSPASASSQARLRAPGRSQWTKVDDVLGTYGFANIGEFLALLFHPHIRGQKDHRTKRHRQAVAAFLQGRTSVKMAQIIELLYDHHKNRPKKNDADQYSAAFSARRPLSEIQCARPCLSSWATRLVGNRAYYCVGKLAQKQRGHRTRRHLRAHTNGRTENAEVVEWEDTEFGIQELAVQYEKEDPFLWYLTECFVASRKKGRVIVKKTRPHPVIQVGAINSFIVSRNQYASGELALPLGIWLFACQAHVDVKRVFCRFGFSVSDSTARNALNSMTESSLNKLREDVQDATEKGEVRWGKVLDNIQRYDRVFEHGLGWESQLKVGTACTAFRLDNCKPSAFNADDHVARVITQERQTMTTENVYSSIDWKHNYDITELHFVRRRLPPIQTVLQPLGTNSEREVENRGMQNALLDFDKQMGVEPEKSDNILSWVRGDGASHATVMCLKKILATSPDIYHSFRNVISTPETWHTKATDLNSCASNHYGLAASKDPSSLSRSSNTANMKRPTDLKKCDFYPTSRSMTLIWEARVLDCWRRLILGCDSDLITHFGNLASKKTLPLLDTLLEQSSIIRERYASQIAYNQSLDKTEQDDALPRNKFPGGSLWNDNEPAVTTPPTQKKDAPKKSHEDGPKNHEELPEFDGDRVLSNSILFLMEFGWWTELSYAIPEGDVGWIIEIFKVRVHSPLFPKPMLTVCKGNLSSAQSAGD